MLAVRIAQPAFHPDAEQAFLKIDHKAVAFFLERLDEMQAVAPRSQRQSLGIALLSVAAVNKEHVLLLGLPFEGVVD